MRDFKHTMDLLVQAYFDNTLKHGNCSKCAVGNICGGDSWKAFFEVIGNIYETPDLLK